MDAVLDLARTLESSSFGAFVRSSSWAYPTANIIHLLGLVMLVGSIGILDLRVAGLFRSLPLNAVSTALTPIAILGLVLIAPSGLTLFAADATALVTSATFRWKMALLVIALSNAAAFRLWWARDIAADGYAPPLVARASALASILLWLWMAALGRLIAYA